MSDNEKPLFLRPAPKGLYHMVYGLGGPHTPPDGMVKVGGSFLSHVNYDQSYLYSARLLIERAIEERRLRDVVLPVTYLQRHAFEVALKDVINAAYDLEALHLWDAALAKNRRAAFKPGKKAEENHNLRGLFEALKSATPLSRRATTDLRRMVEVLEKVERKVPERLRYEMVRPAKAKKGKKKTKTSTRIPSFRREVLIRPIECQERLEAVFCDHLAYRGDESPRNLLEEIVCDLVGLDEYLESKRYGNSRS